jgi:hypothetical protein
MTVFLRYRVSGDPVQSTPSTYAPAGRWRYVESDPVRATSLKSYLTLDPGRGSGSIIDTITIGGVDSVATTTLSYNGIGDGYQRMLMIHERPGALPDTTLSYWYFFRRGDTLLYYSGMRYLGSSPRLRGAWANDPADLSFIEERCRFEFGVDSVRIIHEDTTGGETAETLRYTAVGDTLTLPPNSCIVGERYEVTPGISLYITSRPSRRYIPVK